MSERKYNSQPAIRPDEAKRRRTHKPEAISWQCIDVRDKHSSQPAIRPDVAKRRRTHKPEAISWQCKDVRKKTQPDGGNYPLKMLVLFHPLFPAFAGILLHIGNNVSFVHDFDAHNGFDNILESYDTLKSTVFVND